MRTHIMTCQVQAMTCTSLVRFYKKNKLNLKDHLENLHIFLLTWKINFYLLVIATFDGCSLQVFKLIQRRINKTVNFVDSVYTASLKNNITYILSRFNLYLKEKLRPSQKRWRQNFCYRKKFYFCQLRFWRNFRRTRFSLRSKIKIQK